jgi:hypothetical protein
MGPLGDVNNEEVQMSYFTKKRAHWRRREAERLHPPRPETSPWTRLSYLEQEREALHAARSRLGAGAGIHVAVRTEATRLKSRLSKIDQGIADAKKELRYLSAHAVSWTGQNP